MSLIRPCPVFSLNVKAFSSLIAVCGSVLLLIVGCSDKITSHPGVYTKYVNGTLKLADTSSDHAPFILVRKHNRSFVETSNGPLDRVSVAIVHPDNNGAYMVDFDNATLNLETIFIARLHRIQSLSFSRTLGIGHFETNAQLQKDSNWKNNFYFVIKPLLSDYITEHRYQLSDYEKKFLGDWMLKSEAAFEKQQTKDKDNETKGY